MNEKTKTSMNKEEKETLIMLSIIALAVVFAVFIAYAIYPPPASIYPPPASNPTKTFYLASNLFPLKAYEYMEGGEIRFPQYAFYGTPQPNGTECISNVAVYSFNYTTQKVSTTPQIITDPKQVAKIYYNYATPEGTIFVNSSESSAYIVIPENYTLLCPNIVNATRWP